MLVESVNFNIVKILFDANKENLLPGEVVKITNNDNYGVLAQIFEIESSKDRASDNIAAAKILYTIKSGNQSVNWQGNAPSREFKVKKISGEEFLFHIKGLKLANPVSLGSLSLYDNIRADIEAARLESPTLIFCDKQFQRINITHLLAKELVKNDAHVVLLDFRGEYSYIQEAGRLEAGNNFKLALDSRRIEGLYERCLANASAEARAIIEDIFMNIQDYADSSETGFIPFDDFKSVVDAEYKENSVTELILLKNQLAKLEKQNLYANTLAEAEILKEYLDNHKFIIVDLSKVSPIWHKEFVDFIVNFNIEKCKKRFFMMLEAQENNIDDKIINKIYVDGCKNGIKPIIALGYTSKFVKTLTAVAKNFIFCATSNKDKFPEFEKYLSKLSFMEILIYGKISNYIPLFVKPDKLISEADIEGDSRIFNNYSENLEENIPEAEIDFENLEKFFEEMPPEIIIPENNSVEEMPVQENMYFENSDDSLEYEYVEQDLDIIQSFQDYSDVYNPEIIEQEASEEENYSEDHQKAYESDIETFYTAKKPDLEPDYDTMPPEKELEESSDFAAANDIPIYTTHKDSEYDAEEIHLEEGDSVSHQKYGVGVIKKIISYGNKKLCSIHFENIGRRLLDPELAGLQKV